MTIREIAGPAGHLEALIEEPPKEIALRAAVVLAHPHPLHGGTMHTKAVYHLAKGFTRIGCAVLRFNFRGVGTSEGTFHEGPGEMADFRAGLDFMAKRHPHTELWAAGFSFGAWVALTVGALDDQVTTLVGVAPPITTCDFSAVRDSMKPKFLIVGERDEVAPLRTVREFYAQIPEPKELVVIDMADHLFDGHVTELADTIEDLLGDVGRSP